MRTVVTGFNLRTASSFLQSGLGDSQRRILGGYIALETLNVTFLLSNFLKDFKLLNSSQWEVGDGDGGPGDQYHRPVVSGNYTQKGIISRERIEWRGYYREISFS